MSQIRKMTPFWFWIQNLNRILLFAKNKLKYTLSYKFDEKILLELFNELNKMSNKIRFYSIPGLIRIFTRNSDRPNLSIVRNQPIRNFWRFFVRNYRTEPNRTLYELCPTFMWNHSNSKHTPWKKNKLTARF